MKIAIIGTGISGLSAAWLLAQGNEISLFEANHYIGGHTHTVAVTENEKTLPVDTGFIVFNKQNYPNLCQLFEKLGVDSRDTDMSFSVKCEQTGLEYNGASMRSLFAQKRNLFNLPFLGMLKDMMGLHKQAAKSLSDGLDDAITVADYVKQHGYSRYFMEKYLLPLGASLWSCPPARFRDFPMRFVIEFLNNHCMLQLHDRPVWKTVVGGSSQYIDKLTASFADRLFTDCAVKTVARNIRGVSVTLENGQQDEFDEVILACHSNQSLRMLSNPDTVEQELLSQFDYQYNEAILHTDTTILPQTKRAWASWNYRIPLARQNNTLVTYNMNRLQGFESPNTYCVSLNQADAIDKNKIIKKIAYHHPVFKPGREAAQKRHHELIRRNRISYCGAYWGYGFHEDGLNSGLAVAAAYNRVMS